MFLHAQPDALIAYFKLDFNLETRFDTGYQTSPS
jgi:hypothetical protein